jgi:hypothetical protein
MAPASNEAVQRPGDRRINILDVKELFNAMRDQGMNA